MALGSLPAAAAFQVLKPADPTPPTPEPRTPIDRWAGVTLCSARTDRVANLTPTAHATWTRLHDFI